MKFTAEIGGASWANPTVATFDTIKAARRWAEEFGSTADWCRVTDGKKRIVASHRRDASGNGMKWFRAKVES